MVADHPLAAPGKTPMTHPAQVKYQRRERQTPNVPDPGRVAAAGVRNEQRTPGTYTAYMTVSDKVAV